MKPTNKISLQEAGFSTYNLSEKCKVCGYRSGLHYEMSHGFVFCPAKPRKTKLQQLQEMFN